jgi:hypothetical protein
MQKSRRLRTVIETTEFLTQKAKFNLSAQRLDEVLFGVTWALARHPEYFSQVLPKSDIRLIKTDSILDVPAFRIFFTFNSNEVRLLWIEAIEVTS